MAKIGLLGLGTVGTGVYEIINEKRGNFFEKEDDILISKILVRDKTKKRSLNINNGIYVDDINEIISDEEISIVIAVMGSYEKEYEYIKMALSSKKSVVTANKEIIAKHFKELLRLAEENNVNILFEASVGGGIPIINSILETIKINKINKIQGILNGTTNFIVSKMTNEEKDFGEILKLAQDMGFAEADPTADVEGYDISRKIAILSSLCYQCEIDDDDIYKRGISNITLDDIKAAEKMGYVFKYLAESERYEDDTFGAYVAPVLLHKEAVISNVNEEYNIITINGNIIGNLSFLGKGAGKDATANAIVQDVVKIIKDEVSLSHVNFDNKLSSCGISKYKSEFYLRVSVRDDVQFDKVVDIVSRNIDNLNLVYENSKIFFTTKEVSGDFMKKLYERLKLVADDVFYARIVNNIL